MLSFWLRSYDTQHVPFAPTVECTVCMDADATVVCIPCGHRCFCAKCATSVHLPNVAGGSSFDAVDGQHARGGGGNGRGGEAAPQLVMRDDGHYAFMAADAAAAAAAGALRFKANMDKCPICRAPVTAAMRIF